MEAANSLMRPLDGITIVSLEHAVAAPFCTRQLADLGARVVKVERPGEGDFARRYDTRVLGQASHFVWINRSKESLAVDIKSEDGKAILRALLGKADVLVQNLAPGAADRLGLSFEVLSAQFPSLIVCNISGYGQGGPYCDKKAYDLLIQSEAGFISVTGSEAEPAKAGCSIADIAAGMYAYTNILAALIERGKTGKGRCIDISMLESLVEWMSFPLYYAFDGAPPPPRVGAAHATIFPYGPFKAGDGQNVMLGIQNDREWTSFCSIVLRRPDLIDDPRFAVNSSRNQARLALQDILESVFANLTTQELIGRLDQAGIANAQVNDMRQVWEHPQLAARGRWTTVETPGGPIPALLPPGQSAADAPRMDPVPWVGQHNLAILRELGFEPD